MSVAIVAAHPDDEILGIGALLPRLRRQFTVIHVTDGAPRTGDDVRLAGCSTWQEYAALRRSEFQKALEAAGGTDEATLCLDCPDQQASFHIAEHAERLAEILDWLRPSLVFTHAYEGGHPDHDATAAAVHAATWLCKERCAVAEFAGYHSGEGGMECECFLDGQDVMPRPLSQRESQWKREILSCYASQSRILGQFPLKREPLRRAPQYDFAKAPHEGPLYYEHFSWGVNSAEWRKLAERAFHELRLPCVC
ncbi:MAG TPA: PIG-L family deacetylase [Bryobacteraceae bacterium]|nr:PIG-L family deacetylase [Bryobacteraceae bacterium]